MKEYHRDEHVQIVKTIEMLRWKRPNSIIIRG